MPAPPTAMRQFTGDIILAEGTCSKMGEQVLRVNGGSAGVREGWREGRVELGRRGRRDSRPPRSHATAAT